MPFFPPSGRTNGLSATTFSWASVTARRYGYHHIFESERNENVSYLSLQFLAFLIVLLCLYYLVPKLWMKQGIILAGNMVFFWGAGWSALLIVLGTALAIYAAARLIGWKYAGYEREKEDLPLKKRVELFNAYKKKARWILYAALAFTVGIFVYVKIGRYLGWQVSELAGFSFGKSVIIPLGVSYYTFMCVGYLLDVYWNKIKAQRSYFKFLLCVTYFPHIISGPFSRLDKLMEQFDRLPKFEYKRFCFGAQLALWGLFQKLVIAEGLHIFVSTVKASVTNYAGLEIVIALIFSVLFNFADFSGCMDLVRGISQMIGVELDENFRQPFFAKSISEFWRRWHITLGAWMRDYIFVPITRSKKFRSRGQKIVKRSRVGGILFNVGIPSLLAWLFSGLWHGTGVHYIFWGMYYAVLQLLAEILVPAFDTLCARLRIDRTSRYFSAWRSIRTVGLFCVGGSLTFLGSADGCVTVWRQAFSELRPWVLFDGSLYNYGLGRQQFWMVMICVGVLLLAEACKEKGVHIREAIAAKPLALRWCAYYALIFAILIFGFYGPGYNASDFVYARF